MNPNPNDYIESPNPLLSYFAKENIRITEQNKMANERSDEKDKTIAKLENELNTLKRECCVLSPEESKKIIEDLNKPITPETKEFQKNMSEMLHRARGW